MPDESTQAEKLESLLQKWANRDIDTLFARESRVDVNEFKAVEPGFRLVKNLSMMLLASSCRRLPAALIEALVGDLENSSQLASRIEDF